MDIIKISVYATVTLSALVPVSKAVAAPMPTIAPSIKAFYMKLIGLFSDIITPCFYYNLTLFAVLILFF